MAGTYLIAWSLGSGREMGNFRLKGNPYRERKGRGLARPRFLKCFGERSRSEERLRE